MPGFVSGFVCFVCCGVWACVEAGSTSGSGAVWLRFLALEPSGTGLGAARFDVGASSRDSADLGART